MSRALPALFALVLTACGSTAEAGTEAAPPLEDGQAEAIFAGGCFWCLEKDMDHVDGVLSTTSGYTGGKEEHPTYEQVGYHQTTHYEAVRVVYDPKKVDYATLLDAFWHSVDPTQSNGQFCDKGDQYRTAIFTSDKKEKKLVEESTKKVAAELEAEIDTKLLPAAVFWVAEDYHQDFYKKSPGRYNSYRTGCGRDKRIKELWGKPPPSARH